MGNLDDPGSNLDDPGCYVGSSRSDVEIHAICRSVGKRDGKGETC